MGKEFTSIDEVLLQDMMDEVSDDILQDDGFGMAIDILDDSDDDDVSDSDLIDIVMKGEK